MRKYNRWEELKDERQYNFGEIWKLRDELIRLLPSDRLEGHRNIYPSRTVVITQNCDENDDEDSILIRVAPLSTQVRFLQKFDVELSPEDDEVKESCMVQVQLSQPVLKKDLYRKVGEISTEKKNEIAVAKLNLLGIDPSMLG